MSWDERAHLISFKAGQIGGVAGAVALAGPRSIYALGQAAWFGAKLIGAEIRCGCAYIASRFVSREITRDSLRWTASRMVKTSVNEAVLTKTMPGIDQILFGQKTVSAFFSKDGNFKGMAISEVVKKLKNGTISPESLPIDIIVHNGQKITLNNRSLLALKRAGIAPKIINDKTGIPFYESVLDNHLKGSSPCDFIKIRGGPPGTSLIIATE